MAQTSGEERAARLEVGVRRCSLPRPPRRLLAGLVALCLTLSPAPLQALGTPTATSRAPQRSTAPTGLLRNYPRPAHDSGFGFHISGSPYPPSRDVMVREVAPQLKAMGATWVTLWATDPNQVDSVKYLVDSGFEVILRYHPIGAPHPDYVPPIEELKIYTKIGVHYFQTGNEPNLACENPGADGAALARQWVASSSAVRAAGGIPLLYPMSPGGHRELLTGMLAWLKENGELKTLEGAGIAIHNRPLNKPLSVRDSTSFLEYEWIDDLVVSYLGHSLPMFGTEAGYAFGELTDQTYPRIDGELHKRYNLEIAQGFRDGRWRDALFTETFWMLSGYGHYAFPADWWIANPLDFGQDLPAVAGFKAMPRFERAFRGGGTAASAVATATPRPNAQTKAVRWGYHVTYDPASLESLRQNAKSLTHVSPAWYELDGAGELFLLGDDQDEVTTLTRRGGAALVPTVSGRGEALHALLADAAARGTAVAALRDEVVKQGYAGAHVYFEGIDPADESGFTAFVRELGEALRPKGKLVTVAVPALGSTPEAAAALPALDYTALGADSDLLVLLATRTTPRTEKPGPAAPLPWLEDVLRAAVSDVPPAKLVVGIPLYGYDWNVTVDLPAVSRGYVPTAQLFRSSGARIQYDETNGAVRAAYTANGQAHEVWYEDARSIQAKASLATRFGLAGVAYWRLGHEDPAIWKAQTAAAAGKTVPTATRTATSTATRTVALPTATPTRTPASATPTQTAAPAQGPASRVVRFCAWRTLPL